MNRTNKLSTFKKYMISRVVPRSKRIIWPLIRTLILLGICFIILQPLIVMISTSFKTRADLFDGSVVWIPRNFSWSNVVSNYNYVIRLIDYPAYLFDTILYTVLTTLVQLISSCVIGYGFARFKFPGRKLLFGIVILTMIIPPITTVIPVFLHLRYFDIFGIFKLLFGNTLNLRTGMIPSLLLGATGFGLKNGLYIFIFRQYFKNLPIELDEAAYIDGCGSIRTFFYIGMRLCGSVALVVLLFSVVWQWTDTFYTSFLTSGIKHLTAALPNIRHSITSYAEISVTGKVMRTDLASAPIYNNAGLFLTILPLLIFYLIAQKFFIQGVEKSGIVG